MPFILSLALSQKETKKPPQKQQRAPSCPLFTDVSRRSQNTLFSSLTEKKMLLTLVAVKYTDGK